MTNNLRKIRLAKKMTQMEVCKAAGISTTQDYYKHETKGAAPRIDKALRIARALGVGVEKIWSLNQ